MRIAMGIEYHGSLYHGWQSQEGLCTIQQTLETALSKVANHPVSVHCAGRTDKGVHALGQVAHFDTTAERDERSWLLGTNVYLPSDVRIKSVQQVDLDFHARFSAKNRVYQYWIYNSPTASAILHNRVSWIVQPLNEEKMLTAAKYLLGEHDFTSFRGRDCQAKSPVRRVQHVDLFRRGDFVCFEISANGFLHHMVRNIVGSLFQVGSGRQSTDWFGEVLSLRNREKAGVMAPAEGLYLYHILYEQYEFKPLGGWLFGE